MNIHERLEAMGAELPKVVHAVADYEPAVRIGRRVLVSGQVPLVDGQPAWRGRVGGEVSVPEAGDAAVRCVLNGLAAVDRLLDGDWHGFARMSRVRVFVAGTEGFTDAHVVANHASKLLTDLFGEAGKHARAAVVVAGLPLNVPVEIEFELELATDPLPGA